MKSFIVRWHASGYNGTFRYLVVAENLEQAKEIWEAFVTNDDSLSYSWQKAKKAVEQHYGGYIAWDYGRESDEEKGCYKLKYDRWNVGSDHLWD